MRAGGNSGQSNRQSGYMGQCVEIRGAAAIANPETFLAGSFKAGVVALTLGTQGIGTLESEAVSVNGEAVIGGQCDILGTAAVLFAVVPVFVAAGANAGFGLAEGAAEFLANPSVVRGFPVLVHGEAGLADGIADRELLRVFCAALVEGDYSFSLIDVFYQVVDSSHVVAFIAQESTFPEREDGVGSGEDVWDDRGVCYVGGRGQFVERQAGNAVHQHMVFVAPVELTPPLVVLVGGGMDAESAVRVGLGVIFRLEPALGERLRIVLPGIRGHRSGVQADEGSVHDAQFIELLHLLRHDIFQFPVVQLFEETVIGPVGRQRLHDVKAAVVGDEPVVVQIIHQICDL